MKVATKQAVNTNVQDSLLSAQRETDYEKEADMQMAESSMGKRQRTDGKEEGVGETSDSECLLSSEAGNSNRNQKPQSKKEEGNYILFLLRFIRVISDLIILFTQINL